MDGPEEVGPGALVVDVVNAVVGALIDVKDSFVCLVRLELFHLRPVDKIANTRFIKVVLNGQLIHEHGVANELIVFENSVHGFQKEDQQQALSAMAAWFEKQLAEVEETQP